MSVLADEQLPREEDLESRQGSLYPVGRALRHTFDADNHDSLGTDLTGLMLELTRIDNEGAPGRGALPPAPAPGAPTAPANEAEAPPPSGWRSLLRRLMS